MGEVFRGRDTRLNRDVAIKILPPLFADDPERLARFEREAQILASLNHPNIAHIYGIEESSGRKALVMELVDGDDLAVHIARTGAMPLGECLAVARQIADALACAHEQGVVHRDLKPANLKVRDDGTVKVLDFGLAKLADPLSSGGPAKAGSYDVLNSPTITSPSTQLGVILGTAAYMAPEQARGKAVDKRADVWAFGIVLYEMLTGRRAFEGSEISDTLAFVLTKDPDWTALPAGTPPGIRRLLRRCLQKEKKQRLADMSDARLELDEALAPVDVEPASIPPASAPPRSRWRIAAITAAILAAGVVGAAAAAWWILNRPAPTPAVVRFTVPLPEGVAFTNAGRHLLAISPDGTRIVFVANQQLYTRGVGSTSPQPIAGSGSTGPVIGPVFSPDGKHLAYFSSGALRKIGVAGGTPVTLAHTTRNPYGMHWTSTGILTSHGTDGIVRIPADGGQPETVVPGTPETTLQGPQLLPGGEWLMFTVALRAQNRWDTSRIVAQSLKSGERKVLIDGGGDARYLPSGHLLYAVGGVVFAAPFDLAGMTVSGPARPVIEGVRRSAVTGASHFAVAGNGTLIYLPGPADPISDSRRLAFLDRSGTIVAINLPLRAYETPRVSPDGTRIAVTDATDDGADIWIYELSGASAIRRLTFGGRNLGPAWSPDGRHLAFQSDREGDRGLYLQSADGSGAASRLTKAPAGKWHTPGTWSPDGEWLAFSENGPDGPSVHILSLKDKTARPFHADPKSWPTGGPAFSPDGRWLAYHGGSGTERPHIFVEPFPATGARYQISDGLHPAWSRDGSELFTNPPRPGYVAFRIATEPRFAFSPIGPMGPQEGIIGNSGTGRNYDVMPDGKRLLVVIRGTDDERPMREIEVVLNWMNELRNR